MKMLQKKGGFTSRSIDRWVGAVLLCLMALSAGCVISPRRTLGGGSGSGSGSPTPTPTPASSAAGTLYVSNQNTNSILRFNNAGTSTGNVAPAGVISGAATQLNSPRFLMPPAPRVAMSRPHVLLPGPVPDCFCLLPWQWMPPKIYSTSLMGEMSLSLPLPQ